VPIYRAVDLPKRTGADRSAGNRESLSAMAQAVAAGSFAALFPEGKSHDEPGLAPIKTGAARLYYEARSGTAPGRPAPVIVPVGIYYDEKRLFRTRALVWFYPPIELPPALDFTPGLDETVGEQKARVRALTQVIADTLEAIVHPADDWATHHGLHRVRKLIGAERARRAGTATARPSLEEKTLAFARVRDAYYRCREADPAAAAALRRRVEAYDTRLIALRLDDHALDSNPRIFNPALIALSLLQVLLIFVLLPPIVVGYFVNWPVVVAIRGAAARMAKQRKDLATIKILIGCVAFPLAWLLTGIIGVIAHAPLDRVFPRLPDTPILAGVLLALFAAFGGAQALTYQLLARETFRNLRVRITLGRKADVIAGLLRERAGIFDDIMQISAGLSLPGHAGGAGAIVREPAPEPAP
jgi:hypothetical protein